MGREGGSRKGGWQSVRMGEGMGREGGREGGREKEGKEWAST